MSCTINNMGGAGSAVPKLRDEISLIGMSITESHTLYTATQDCLVVLSLLSEGSTIGNWSNSIRINNVVTGVKFSSSGSMSGFAAQRRDLSSQLISIGSGDYSQLVCFMLNSGDVLSMDANSSASSTYLISTKICIYY